jgi:ubiquitin carboxyl-terminal hydrolase 9/13
VDDPPPSKFGGSSLDFKVFGLDGTDDEHSPFPPPVPHDDFMSRFTQDKADALHPSDESTQDEGDNDGLPDENHLPLAAQDLIDSYTSSSSWNQNGGYNSTSGTFSASAPAAASSTYRPPQAHQPVSVLPVTSSSSSTYHTPYSYTSSSTSNSSFPFRSTIVRAPAAGLYNSGNICYANSTLQALLYCRSFQPQLTHLISQISQRDTPYENAAKFTAQANADESLTKEDAFAFGEDAIDVFGEGPPVVNIPPSKPRETQPLTDMKSFDIAHQLRVLFQNLQESSAQAQRSPELSTESAETQSTRDLLDACEKVNPVFCASGNQEDAQEFLRFLLGQLQDLGTEANKRFASEMKPEAAAVVATVSSSSRDGDADPPAKRRKLVAEPAQPSKETIEKPFSLVEQLFQGKLAAITTCQECETAFERHEDFMDLSIDIPPPPPLFSLSKSADRDKFVLEKCLEAFARREWLRDKDKYRCDKCNTLVEAARDLKVSQLPQILTIHLKRFKWGSYGTRMEKVTHCVDCPDELDLPKMILRDPKRQIHESKYKLIAFVVHFGSSASFGHYTTYVRADRVYPNPQTKHPEQWICFDDDGVDYVSTDKVDKFFDPGATSTSSAYILFYEKCDPDPNMKMLAELSQSLK